MFKALLPAFRLLLLMTAITGVAYPLAVTGIAQAIFPQQAAGSLVTRGGKVVGSALLAQSFAQPQYFHPRPSAAGKGYDAASSSGSNLGPTSQTWLDGVKANLDAVRVGDAPAPVELVTASASGLDPDLSPEAAGYEAPRIAAARGLPLAQVEQLIGQHVQDRVFGVLGERRVNVLELNLALDEGAGR